MTIREASNTDGPELARLRWEFSPDQVATDRQSKAAFAVEYAAWIDHALREGRWKIWVAESGSRLMGNLYVEIIPKLPRPGEFKNHFAYMTNVYVAEEERNQGVGSRLVDAAITWASANGIEFTMVWPSLESVAFYERHAFRLSAAMERRQ